MVRLESIDRMQCLIFSSEIRKLVSKVQMSQASVLRSLDQEASKRFLFRFGKSCNTSNPFCFDSYKTLPSSRIFTPLSKVPRNTAPPKPIHRVLGVNPAKRFRRGSVLMM